MSKEAGIIIAFIAYFVIVLVIGFIFMRRTKNLKDYILGGRGLNPWVTALSAQASDMSGWLLMGLPGAIYVLGTGQVWIGIGLAIGTYIAWRFIARKLRNYTEVAGDALTLPEYFENRFEDKTGILRVVSAIVIIFFFVIYAASGFNAVGQLFVNVFPNSISYEVALIIGAAVIIAYTLMGGFMAVCWTDFFQGLMMLVAIIVTPIIAINAMGGIDGMLAQLNAVEGLPADFLNLFNPPGGGAEIISGLAWGLGYLGMPHILVRYMAIRDPREIKVSRRVGTTWVVLSLLATICVGIVGRAYLGNALVNAGSEQVFMVLVTNLFPPLLAGVLLSAILAAIMSTADSQLLVVSSAVSGDLVKKWIKRPLSDKKLVWISRLTIIVVAIIAVLLALDPKSTVMGLVSYAWAGFGAAFGPVVLLSLFWRKINMSGAVSGMIVGAATTVLWNTFLTGPTGIYELLPGFVLALLTIVVVSLNTKAPSQKVLDDFDKTTALDRSHGRKAAKATANAE